MNFITETELLILDFIRDHLSCKFLDFIVPKFTSLGNAGLCWIVLAVVFMFFKRYRRCGILMITGLLLGVILGNGILKNVIARERPCWINSNVQLLISNPTDYSFPSGHTLSSFVSATVILINHRKFGIFAMIFATLMGLSRIYLYVHFISDVIFGAALGMLLAYLVCKFSKKIRLLDSLS